MINIGNFCFYFSDTQAPSFSFCTVIDYTITMLTAPNFLVPVPQDNSGLVQYMTVTTSNSRSNFHPSHVIDEDMTVTYTAFDAVGNAQSCQIAIHIRGMPSDIIHDCRYCGEIFPAFHIHVIS